MNPYLKVSIVIIISLLLVLTYVELKKGVWAGPPATLKNEAGKPLAVLSVDFGEMPRQFETGGFYALKVLKVRGTKVDFGFCQIKEDL